MTCCCIYFSRIIEMLMQSLRFTPNKNVNCEEKDKKFKLVFSILGFNMI